MIFILDNCIKSIKEFNISIWTMDIIFPTDKIKYTIDLIVAQSYKIPLLTFETEQERDDYFDSIANRIASGETIIDLRIK